MEYKIVLGKDLQVGDRIVHNCNLLTIISVSPGKHAGSLNFGEYIAVSAHDNIRDVIQDFWTYQECPMVVLIPQESRDG